MSGEVEIESLVAGWNACHGAFFQLRDCDVRWNLHDQKWLRYELARCAGIPVLLAEATAEGVQVGISAATFWVSLYGKPPPGQCEAFLLALQKRAREAAKLRLVIGGDDFHFLPGLPEGDDLLPVVAAAGAKLTACSDYAGPLSSPAILAYQEGALRRAEDEGWTLGRVETAEEKAELGRFLHQEFPGRWEREWLFWNSSPATGRASWYVLRASTAAVLGFARLSLRGRVMPPESGWTPGALRLPLDPGRAWKGTDSCLGPIGVSASVRGRGLGKVLLGLALAELQDNGAEFLCIDWTDAHGFYAALGLAEVRKYFSVRVSL